MQFQHISIVKGNRCNKVVATLLYKPSQAAASRVPSDSSDLARVAAPRAVFGLPKKGHVSADQNGTAVEF